MTGTADSAETMERYTDRAFDWVEHVTGGTIVRKVEQRRWRPQWFLDVAMPGGGEQSLLLRGWRAPGVVETADRSRQRLAREAGILAALDATPVRSPAYHGYEPEGGWILMERVAGDDLLTDVADPDRQRILFVQYIEDIAAMHRIDPDTLDLPEGLYRPKDHESNATWNYTLHRANFRAANCAPDPLLEFAWSWLERHRPRPVERYSLCTGDIGANQFLFEGDRYTALFDVEMAYVGDPLQDIGLMRYRNTCYPAAQFDAVVRAYHVALGRPIDIESLNYWTVVGLLGVMPTFAPLVANPDPRMPADMTLIWAMMARRRVLVSAFQQIYGFATPPLPDAPIGTAAPVDGFARFVPESIAQHWEPAAGSDEMRHALRFLRAHAEIAERQARIGAAILRDDLDDMAAFLGHRPADVAEGRRAMAEAILADPERDLEARLAALYRIEARREYLLEPAQRAVGFATFAPLDGLGRADALIETTV